MTNQQILTKAVKKAQTSGWWTTHDIVYTIDMGWTATVKHGKAVLKPGEGYITILLAENDIIFNHDFAKALWGDEQWFLSDLGEWHKSAEHPDWLGTDEKLAWQYHLQQMVIATDPIKYLGEHL